MSFESEYLKVLISKLNLKTEIEMRLVVVVWCLVGVPVSLIVKVNVIKMNVD